MTEIPEHLRRRAREALEKAALHDDDDYEPNVPLQRAAERHAAMVADGSLMRRESFVQDVLDVYWRADCEDDVRWTNWDGELRLYATCSDVFHWATADSEQIVVADVPLLRQTWQDLREIDGEHHLSWLFACRKRGMRPMRLAMTDQYMNDAERALFLAAGPERAPGSEG
jgi:hypothetical protein